MKAAVSGVSKTQIIKYIKETYDQSDEQIKQLLRLCNFKNKPKKN